MTVHDDRTVAETLAEDGIARVGRVLDAAQMGDVLGWLAEREEPGDALVQQLQPRFEAGADGQQRRLDKARRAFWSAPEFWAPLIARSRILEIVLAHVGPRAALLFHTAFMKPALVGEAVGLHQDGGVWPWTIPYSLTVWIALTPSTKANGCVVGYRGSHRGGPLQHVLADGTPVDKRTTRVTSWPSVPESLLDPASAVLYELAPGDALIWHRDFVHGSAPNRSRIDRKGISFVFADTSRPGYERPTTDFSGREMAPIEIAEIERLAYSTQIAAV